ncbi:hypothetical protein P43SY_009341 [Pythium insidiosum]|uniref:Uncharacterized protein n=1 Tax=Pythium insidiosum TaxID=114742 RepID=A0AAD5M531_PYTIN|nr:hypothetical protein P43SY_009341 [Pythium insidiosum]
MTGASAEAARAAAASVNQEQLFHEMEQKFLKLKADYAVIESERDALVEQKHASVNEIKQMQDTLAAKDADVSRVNDELLQLRTEREQLSFQVKTATSLAERRLSEIEELQQAVKERSKQLIEAQRKEVEAIQRAAEHETQAHPLRLTTERLTKELETQKQHVDWMEKKLTEKTKSVQDLRQTVAKLTHELEDLRMQHTEEMTAVQRQLESARQVSKKLESSLVHAQEQVKEAQAAKMHDEERFQNELSAQPHGLTSKELYDQILQLEATLRDEREEKEKLKIYMDRILPVMLKSASV